MTGRLCVGLVALLGLCAVGRAVAQASPTATGPGTSIRIGGGVSGFEADYGKRTLGGAVAWTDVNPIWRVGVEGEARWLRLHEDEQTSETTYLVGPRVSIFPGKIEPYVKAMVGAGMFSYPFGYGHGTYLAVAAGAGVDLHLGNRWRVRAIDVEYQRWPEFTFGALSPYGVSAGISYTIVHGGTKLGR